MRYRKTGWVRAGLELSIRKIKEIMQKEKKLPPLGEFLEQAAREFDLYGEVKMQENSSICLLTYQMEIENQEYDVFVQTFEDTPFLVFTVYASYRVMDGKYVDAVLFMNYLNSRFQYPGSISVDEDGYIRYKRHMELDGLDPSLVIIKSMIESAYSLFNSHQEAIAAVALTSRTYESLKEECSHKWDSEENND